MSTMPMSGGYADYDLENQQLERRRKMAEMLAQQSGQGVSPGQMVGNQYVPTSWTQHLAQALKGPLAERELSRLDTQQKQLGERKQNDMRTEMQRFSEALQGREAQTFQPATPNDDEGNPIPSATSEAIPPNIKLAQQLAMGAKNPMLQQWGMSQMMPKTPKWEKAELPNADGSMRIGYVDINSPNPLSTFQAGGTKPVKREYVNGQGVNAYTGEAQGPVIPNQAPAENPRADLLVRGPDGNLVPNQALINAKQSIAKAGAAAGPVVNVNTATKPFLNEIGKGVGEAVISDFGGAKAAAQTLQNAAQIEAGLSKVMVGPAANARVKLAQIGEVLGVNGKDTTEMLQNTRTVIQGLARQELAAAGQMKGQGQITETERGILRRAESGDISELTVPELRTLIGAVRKTANYRINQHNQNLNKLRQDPNAAGVVDFLKVDVPKSNGGWSVER